MIISMKNDQHAKRLPNNILQRLQMHKKIA